MNNSLILKRISSSALVILAICSLAAQAVAQAPLPGAEPGQASGPIDIQANEQEFVGDQVIARGNVKVKFKDSVIVAPTATMVRSPSGAPQTAIFEGHPRLIQGENVIDAEKLIFDIVNQKIVASGNAHSEVVSKDDTEEISPSPDAKVKVEKAPANKTTSKPTKIITDADTQEYDQQANNFQATGHVKVQHGNIGVTADKLQLVYGENKKPETAIFSGNVLARQGKNKTKSDNMTYSLSTGRLQATGHVRSEVIQEKAQAVKPANVSASHAGPDAAIAAAPLNTPSPADVIVITSESQDYSKQTGRMTAEGRVKINYQDMSGTGPQVILIRNPEGKTEKVVFVGRSQISQSGKRWIADKITMLVETKKILAEGNTKAMILQTGPKSTPVPPANQENSRLAGRNGNALSVSRVEATR